MRSTGWFHLAALVTSAMVLAIAAILVPDKSWSTVAIVSLGIYAVAVGFTVYIPAILVKSQDGSDAAQIAAFGPLSAYAISALSLTAGALVLAVLGRDKLAWALDLFAIGSFLVSGLTLRAYAGNAIAKRAAPSKHMEWQTKVQGLRSAAADGKSQADLERLAEKLRYAASDVPDGSPQDGQIDEAVQEMSEVLRAASGASVQSQISRIATLIDQRDVFLRSERSKA